MVIRRINGRLDSTGETDDRRDPGNGFAPFPFRVSFNTERVARFVSALAVAVAAAIIAWLLAEWIFGLAGKLLVAPAIPF